ncbi:septal ring lytic transglycosylase RlpA family protein [Sphingomonas sp. 1P06PA]|uniref:septal ring lytic transglycosylase RlpA family protein n=1 Tax=Sphingomonas sp. 1P06PA TaxID=554121 RepID=UPI0039A478C9
MRAAGALALAGCMALAGCAGDRGRGAAGAVKIGKPYTIAGRTYYPADDRRYDRTGLASWYGPGHAGRATANGERYRPGDLTAAHPTLPMPCLVEVTRLDDGRRVIVRINDRGPFVPGRIIDLSQAAAQRIGLVRDGIAQVRVRRIDRRAATDPVLAQATADGYQASDPSAHK